MPHQAHPPGKARHQGKIIKT
uniref:Uncharacterized protein n=1 Tax=Anguilla anguilla TaxID=7936 RepID=A0A0E9PA48_ANGAN